MVLIVPLLLILLVVVRTLHDRADLVLVLPTGIVGTAGQLGARLRRAA